MHTCGLCLNLAPKLAKSHLFPLALAKDLMEGAPLARLGASSRVERVPHGIYDRVVCPACEDRSGPADEQLVQFAREVQQMRPGDPVAAAKLLQLDSKVDLLQAAFVQMLLRAHLSSRPECAQVQLMPHRLRKMREALLGKRDVFRVGVEVCILHRSDPLGQCTFSLPQRVCVDDYDFYEFSMPGFCIAIADARLPYPFRKVRLRRDYPLDLYSAPTTRRELAAFQQAIAESGGAEAIEEFFESGPGRAKNLK